MKKKTNDLVGFDLETAGIYPRWTDVPEELKSASKSYDFTADTYEERVGITDLAVPIAYSFCWKVEGQLQTASGLYEAEGENILEDKKSYAAFLYEICSHLKVFNLEGLRLTGHNVMDFDIKRLVWALTLAGFKANFINDIMRRYDMKPWEINVGGKVIDTLKLGKNMFGFMLPLQRMYYYLFKEDCKPADFNGGNVHQMYWSKKDREKMRRYIHEYVVIDSATSLRTGNRLVFGD